MATKNDQKKPKMSLIPSKSLTEIAKVFTFGAEKYGDHNWKEGEGLKSSRLLDACLRHIHAYNGGEDLDPESGITHLAHASCNLMMLIYNLDNKTLDDRFNVKEVDRYANRKISVGSVVTFSSSGKDMTRRKGVVKEIESCYAKIEIDPGLYDYVPVSLIKEVLYYG